MPGFSQNSFGRVSRGSWRSSGAESRIRGQQTARGLRVNPQRKDNEEAAVTPCFVPNYSLYLITLHLPAALPRGWAAPRAEEGQSQPQNLPGSGANPRVSQTFLRADWEAGTAPNWCDWGWLRHRRPLFTWLQNAALSPLFSCTGFLCNSAGKHLPPPPHPPSPIPNYTLR